MAFPTTDKVFRTPFFTAVSTPVTTGAGGSTLRLSHNRVEPRMFTDTYDGASLNYDTNGLMTTAPNNANECADSGTYDAGVTTGTTNGVTWDFAITLTKGTTAAGSTMYLGKTGATSTATAVVVATWTGVTWAGGAGAKGCILIDNSATLTAAYPIASYYFGGTVLNPAGGSVTVTFTNGLLTIG